mmetsp:Transcript_59942/g.94941  ORF Transcript_59942/g.94941 Transcript_59942/m.94941 type:complete len:96 (-) Transcript_59942:28-315(-)
MAQLYDERLNPVNRVAFSSTNWLIGPKESKCKPEPKSKIVFTLKGCKNFAYLSAGTPEATNNVAFGKKPNFVSFGTTSFGQTMRQLFEASSDMRK